MSRAFVLGSALALGAGLLFLVWGTRGERGTQEAAPVPVAAPESGGERAPELVTPEVLAADPGEPGPEQSPGARRTSPRDERPTISGFVVVPGGLPVSEEARVTAEVFLGRINRAVVQRLSTPVAREGSFSFRVPEEARYALLDVEGASLHLGEAVKALPGEASVVLSPELLGLIAGRVLPPLGVTLPTAEVSWQDIEVECSSERKEPVVTSLGLVKQHEPDFGPLRVIPNADGTFEIPMAPVGIELVVKVKHPFGPESKERLGVLAPGERRELVIALETGITIAGRVLDEHGRPAVGLDVSAHPAEHLRDRSSRDTRTRADGGFELVELARQCWRVSAGSYHLARPAEVLVDGTEGDVRDLELVVVRGGCIEGTVEWPDGRPVQSFSLSAHGEGSRFGGGAGGSFQLCGLLPGTYRVEARALGEGVAGTARAEGVLVGERALRLVLEVAPVFELNGVVVDAEQAPIQRANLRATKRTGDSTGSRSSRSLQDGSFVLSGLTAGEWTIQARADGFQSAEQSALVSAGASPLRFVLASAGRIRGRVVDAGGTPVQGAAVSGSGLSSGSNGGSAVTDSDGRFEVEANMPHVGLHAVKKGHASSQAVTLDVGAGATVEGVVLRLQEACRLEGRVLDAEGRPVPGVHVFAHASGMNPRSYSEGQNAETDARGEFVLDELPGGEALVTGYRRGAFDERAVASVTLVPGRTSSVELRFERPDPVSVRGRVTAKGPALAGRLFLSSDGFSANGPVGADGRFELILQRPGTWRGALWLGDPLSEPEIDDVRHFELVIPDVETHELALDFDALRRVH